jgi:FAD:protein FMN transferase
MEAVPASIRRARPLLGTFVEIEVARAASAEIEAAVEAAFAAVAEVHRLMSFHEAGSDVTRLNRDAAAGPVRVHDWTYRVLETALDLNRRSAGAFDIAVAPVLQEMGLLPEQPGSCRHEDRLRQYADGVDAIRLLPGRRVRFAHHGIGVDLGGIAKGFAVDRAVDVLRDRGMTDGLVNAGGDLAAFGSRRYPVDIRDPRRPDRAMCRVEVSGAALASSAGRFDPSRSDRASGAAVIDPMTRLPARAVVGATVSAPCCVIADALTKVVMIAGEDAAALLECYGASAMFVSAQDTVHVTADWKNEVRLAA